MNINLVSKGLIQLGILDEIIPKVKSPCSKDCPGRSITCHSTCKEYIKYEKYNAKMRDFRAMISSSSKYPRKVAGA